VLKGVIKPHQCKVFGTACTPESPLGSLMVSSEGACAAYYNYGRIDTSRIDERREARQAAVQGGACPGAGSRADVLGVSTARGGP
jgi:hydrogenase expression/formation protein HypD